MNFFIGETSRALEKVGSKIIFEFLKYAVQKDRGATSRFEIVASIQLLPILEVRNKRQFANVH
jgi:hypothetical protein